MGVMVKQIKSGADPTPEPRLTYGWDQLEVGESYGFFDLQDGDDGRIKRAAYNWGSKNGRKFTVRAVNETDNGAGLRVWRIA